MTRTSRPLGLIFRVTAAAMALVLAGCASTGSNMLTGGPSADSRLTQGKEAEFFSKSGYQACAAAAAVGVLGCLVASTDNKAVCAVAVGIATCGVAMGANYYLDQRRKEYANTSERLTIMTQDIEADTRKIVARSATMEAVIKDDTARMAEIKKQMAAKTMDETAAKKELASVEKNIAFMKKEVSNMQDKMSQYREVADAERMAGNPKQVRLLETKIAETEKRIVALNKQLDGSLEQYTALTLG